MTDYNGILLLKKPAGITSFKSLNSVKKSLKAAAGKEIKVGHTGTLDMFAEGLLVVLTGKFTRFNPVFTNLNKSYLADIFFGTETDTLDPEGRITKKAEIPSLKKIEEAVPDFTGEIKQRPPVFSSIRISGKRSYKRALKGEISELPERSVFVYRFDVLSWDSPVLRCRIDCSKGTYIRSIARDLGQACGSCAHLSSLCRTSVGPFGIENSVDPDSFNPERDLITGRKAFSLLNSADPSKFGLAEIHPEFLPHVLHGKNITDDIFIDPPYDNGSYALFTENRFTAYIRKDDRKYNYIFVAG